MKILDILREKLELNPRESTTFETWLNSLERDARTLAGQSTATGGGRGVSVGNVEISLAEGVTLYNPDTGARTIYLDPDGDASFGDDIDTPADTALKIFSNAQTYNSESIGKGDLLVGDNSTSKANLLWDKSTGQLKFRTGTTTYAYIDTDGGLVASLGTIGGWTIGATTIQDATPVIVLDSANKKITVDTTKVILDASGITAIAGTIAGWTIDTDEIKKTGIILDSAQDQIIVGSGSPTIIVDGGSKVIKSSNYSADAAGFQLSAASGDAEFNNIVARGAFRASVFTYENITAVGGHMLLSKAATTVNTDVTSANPFTLLVEPADDGTTSLVAVGDVIRIKGWNGTAIIDVWGTVTASATAGGVTTLTDVTLESGGAVAIQKGMAVVNYGPTTSGILELQAGEQSTRLRIATHAAAPWTTMTNMVVLGNMRGTFDTGDNDRYGIGVGDFDGGNYLSYNAETANKLVVKAGGGGVILDGDGLVIQSAAGYVTTKALKMQVTTHLYGTLYTATDDATVHEVILKAEEYGNQISQVTIEAESSAGGQALVRLEALKGADLGHVTLASDKFTVHSDVYLVVDDDARIGGGLYVGGTGVDPGAGTIQATGGLYANVDGVGQGDIEIRGGAGSYRFLNYLTGSSLRWRVSADNVAESGSNAGSNFAIYRYTDAAGYLGRPLQIIRSSGDIVIEGDIFSVDWVDYGGSSTVLGWSSFTTKTILYKKIGNTVFCQFAIQGVSSLTTASFTLPFDVDVGGSGQSFQVPVYGIDNGTPQTVVARLDIPASGAVFNVYKNLAVSATWTASGTKGVRGEFHYEAA